MGSTPMVGALVAPGPAGPTASEDGAGIARDLDVAGINARLMEAAERGETLEVVLMVRGSVRRAAGSSRWRIRVAGGRVVTFTAGWVVAATPRPSRRR